METTITANNTFSLNRLGQYMNLYIRSWWRTLASVYGGLILAYIGVTVFVLLVTGNSMYNHPQIPGWSYSVEDTTHDSFWGAECGIAVFMGMIFSLISGGMMFISMRSKDSRMRTLIMPASDLEKYLTVFIFYIVAPYVLFYISLILADLVRMAAIYAFYDYPQYAHLLPWYNLPRLAEVWDIIPSVFALLFCLAMGNQACFALGSIVWYRNSIIKTGVFLYALSIVTSIIASISGALATSSLKGHELIVRSNLDPSDEMVAAIIWTVTLVCCLVTYVLAYFRFKESALNFRW